GKERWGGGRREGWKGYGSVGEFAVNLLWYSLVEAWAWERAEEALVDRSRSPWDAQERRPSHADKRKALQGEVLRGEIRAVMGRRAEQEGFRDLTRRLLDLAA